MCIRDSVYVVLQAYKKSSCYKQILEDNCDIHIYWL